MSFEFVEPILPLLSVIYDEERTVASEYMAIHASLWKPLHHDRRGYYADVISTNIYPEIREAAVRIVEIIDQTKRLLDHSAEYVELTGDGLPYHLRSDATGAQCDRCGRTSWSEVEWNGTCNLPQPSGIRCDGVIGWPADVPVSDAREEGT